MNGHHFDILYKYIDDATILFDVNYETEVIF